MLQGHREGTVLARCRRSICSPSIDQALVDEFHCHRLKCASLSLLLGSAVLVLQRIFNRQSDGKLSLVEGKCLLYGFHNRFETPTDCFSAPVIDDIPIPMHMQHMKGTLEDLDHDIFRQPPSPAVDAAWHALSDHGFAWVSEEQALAMGWDLPVTFKIPEAFGVGNDKYGGETDILHKIHCLDMIRRDVHYDYYWGDKYPDGNRPEAFTVHTSHCIYVLLQSLLCDANTDLIPSVWLDEYPLPVPDFEIQRKCGNFEGVKNWELEHRIEVNRTTLETVKQRPKGQKARPLNAEVRRILEVDTP